MIPQHYLLLDTHCDLGGFNVVKFGDAIDVKGIIFLVTSRLAVGARHYGNLYGMRLHHPGSGESYWLHQDTTMYQVNSFVPRNKVALRCFIIRFFFFHNFHGIFFVQVQEKYERKYPHCEWRYELRVRYLPQNLNDLYEKDKVTFYYYYDQVRGAIYRLTVF